MDHDLALARAAISACADPVMEAGGGAQRGAEQIEEAAAALMMVIGLTETGVDALGELMCCAWRRVVRFGYDESQRTDAESSTMYLFNGATYEAIVGRDKRAALESRMKAHVIACLAAFERLCESPSARERRDRGVAAALAMCRKPRCMAKALKVAFDNIRGRDGASVRPQELAYTLDTEDFIGLTNGVFRCYEQRVLSDWQRATRRPGRHVHQLRLRRTGRPSVSGNARRDQRVSAHGAR
jgi:hypothetical protein